MSDKEFRKNLEKNREKILEALKRIEENSKKYDDAERRILLSL